MVPVLRASLTNPFTTCSAPARGGSSKTTLQELSRKLLRMVQVCTDKTNVTLII